MAQLQRWFGERYCICWFTAQMATVARTAPKSRASSCICISLMGSGFQALASSSAPFPKHISREHSAGTWSGAHMGFWHYSQRLDLPATMLAQIFSCSLYSKRKRESFDVLVHSPKIWIQEPGTHSGAAIWMPGIVVSEFPTYFPNYFCFPGCALSGRWTVNGGHGTRNSKMECGTLNSNLTSRSVILLFLYLMMYVWLLLWFVRNSLISLRRLWFAIVEDRPNTWLSIGCLWSKEEVNWEWILC